MPDALNPIVNSLDPLSSLPIPPHSPLLQCDLLGFHVFDYARHFLSSCARLLPDVSLSPSSVTFRGHTSTVGVYPIGIEPDSFTSVARSPACQARLKDLSAQFGGMKVVVSVDRLDPIKGLPHRLLGLETLFRRRPEWVGKMVFIQVRKVASRTGDDVHWATHQKMVVRRAPSPTQLIDRDHRIIP